MIASGQVQEPIRSLCWLKLDEEIEWDCGKDL